MGCPAQPGANLFCSVSHPSRTGFFMPSRNLLSKSELDSLLHYDRETGVFTWIRKGQRCGQRAGCVAPSGYISIEIKNKGYLAHRLAWLTVTGKHPVNNIDHKNGVRSDNRFENLRDVDQSTNAQNQRAAHKDSNGGLLGISWHKRDKKWVARLRVRGTLKNVGRFDDKNEAHEAYIKAKRLFHEGCTI